MTSGKNPLRPSFNEEIAQRGNGKTTGKMQQDGWVFGVKSCVDINLSDDPRKKTPAKTQDH